MKKVAIAAMSSEFNAQIAEHAARAPYFIIHDSETGQIESLSNPVAEARRAAGPQAAEFLIGLGVDKVVAARFGEKFRVELEEAGIDCQLSSGTVSAYING